MTPNKDVHIHYDEEGDLLELRVGKSSGTYMKNLGGGIFERVDEKTGKTRGFVIVSFKKKIEKSKSVSAPLSLIKKELPA